MNKEPYFYQNPLLVLQIGGWSAYAITDHIGHLVYGGSHLFASLASGLIGYLLTGGLAIINNKLSINSLLLRLLIFAPSLFIFAVIWKNIFNLLHEHTSLAELANFSIVDWFSGASYSFYLFVAWAGLYLGSKYFLTSREQHNALNEALLATKQAQLQTLRYQLNPHFLFNVLNSIDVAIMEGEQQVSHQMVNHLSDFLRSSLKHQDRDKITLQEEMEVMQEFIHIEKFRFGEDITIDIDISGEANKGLLPPMLLLPLIENAVKYAWNQSEQGKITLSASVIQKHLDIKLRNSKSTMQAQVFGTGTGLSNTLNRLKVAYAGDATLEVDETNDSYQVNLILPWISHFIEK